MKGLALAVLLVGCAQARPAPTAERPLSFKLPRLGSEEAVDLGRDRGQVVLLDLWATWCEPCVETLPQHAALLRLFEPRGFRLYAISVDEDRGKLEHFVERHRIAVPVLVDPGATVADSLQVDRIPTTVLLDRRGHVRHVHLGYTDGIFAVYTEQIEALLAEPAP